MSDEQPRLEDFITIRVGQVWRWRGDPADVVMRVLDVHGDEARLLHFADGLPVDHGDMWTAHDVLRAADIVSTPDGEIAATPDPAR